MFQSMMTPILALVCWTLVMWLWMYALVKLHPDVAVLAEHAEGHKQLPAAPRAREVRRAHERNELARGEQVHGQVLDAVADGLLVDAVLAARTRQASGWRAPP